MTGIRTTASQRDFNTEDKRKPRRATEQNRIALRASALDLGSSVIRVRRPGATARANIPAAPRFLVNLSALLTLKFTAAREDFPIRCREVADLPDCCGRTAKPVGWR